MRVTMQRTVVLMAAATLVMLLVVRTVPAENGPSQQEDVQAAEGRAAQPSPATIAALRSEGPAALERLFGQRGEILKEMSQNNGERWMQCKHALEQLDALIDQVGGQRYCTASRLFWYTDLEAARQAAAEWGKPLLSLRMLGNLTDELSCANSRYFRTTLYANERISKYLRENFVLHWKSVRPGAVLDCLPGLYSPLSHCHRLRNSRLLRDRLHKWRVRRV